MEIKVITAMPQASVTCRDFTSEAKAPFLWRNLRRA